MGRKGSGKTTLAIEIMREYPRVFALDMMGDYGAAGFEVHWGLSDSIRAMEQACSGEGRRRFRLALQVVEKEDMLSVLDMAWECPDTLMVIEETSFVCSPQSLPRELSRLVRFGRHRQISQLYITRRAAELPRDLTAQSDLLVTFQQKEPRDLQYLQSYGFDTRVVAGLPPYQITTFGELDKAPLAVLSRLHQQELFTKKPLTASAGDDMREDEATEPEALDDPHEAETASE